MRTSYLLPLALTLLLTSPLAAQQVRIQRGLGGMRPQATRSISYFHDRVPVVWRTYPTDQRTHGSMGQDTLITIHGLAERFTSPFAKTYLDSVQVAVALPHYVEFPDNDIIVEVFGSVKVPSGGLFADLSNRMFTASFHPSESDINEGLVLTVDAEHTPVDTDFFVATLERDTDRTHIVLGIAVDSITSETPLAFSESRDRGREMGETYQSYMAGAQYQPGLYWYSNPLYIAYVSDELANVAAVSSNGIQLFSPFPNPAIANVSIRYVLPAPCAITIQVSDAAGKIVREQSEGMQTNGVHTLSLSTNRLKEGVYHYTLSAGRAIFHGKFEIK